jgi:hypothetical protein
MTHFVDLGPWTYFGDRGPRVLAVGWLEAGHPYARASVSGVDVTTLEQLAVNTWQPMFAKGWHNRSLCGKTDEDEPFVRLIGGEHKLLVQTTCSYRRATSSTSRRRSFCTTSTSTGTLRRSSSCALRGCSIQGPRSTRGSASGCGRVFVKRAFHRGGRPGLGRPFERRGGAHR